MTVVDKKAKELKDLKDAQRVKIKLMLDTYFDQKTHELLSVKLGRASIKQKLNVQQLIEMFTSIKEEGNSLSEDDKFEVVLKLQDLIRKKNQFDNDLSSQL